MMDVRLAVERDRVAADHLERGMRAGNAVKGGAGIVGVTAGVAVTHVMEDCFVAAQHGAITLRRRQIDAVLRGVDLLKRIAQTPDQEIGCWDGEKKGEIDDCVSALGSAIEAGKAPQTENGAANAAPGDENQVHQSPEMALAAVPSKDADRVLRVTAQNLNRLLGLSGA